MLRQLLLCLFGNLHLRYLLTVIFITLMSINTISSRTLHRRRIGPADEKSLNEWDDVFNQRDDDDWRLVWHKEKHRRCQHQLLTHMELVCDKDIYKTARRKRSLESFQPDKEWFNQESVPNQTVSMEIGKWPDLFISAQDANRFGHSQLRSILPGEHKRTSGLRRKRGISDECCSGADGCSWEEYAEYCPANVRVRA